MPLAPPFLSKADTKEHETLGWTKHHQPPPTQPRIRPGSRKPLPFPWEWNTSQDLTRKNHFL